MARCCRRFELFVHNTTYYLLQEKQWRFALQIDVNDIHKREILRPKVSQKTNMSVSRRWPAPDACRRSKIRNYGKNFDDCDSVLAIKVAGFNLVRPLIFQVVDASTLHLLYHDEPQVELLLIATVGPGGPRKARTGILVIMII